MSKQNDKQNKNANKTGFNPIGLCFGAAIGMCFGTATGNMALGICMGMGVGLCFCVALGSLNTGETKKNEDETKEDDKQ